MINVKEEKCCLEARNYIRVYSTLTKQAKVQNIRRILKPSKEGTRTVTVGETQGSSFNSWRLQGTMQVLLCVYG